MSQTAKAQEPSMEEILASIRRIIADDDGGKPAARVPEPPPAPLKAPPPVVAAPRPAPPPTRMPPPPVPPPAPANKQDDIDAMLADVAPAPTKPAPAKPAPAAEVLDLTEDMTTPTFRTIDGGTDVFFAERPPEQPEAPRAPAAPAPAPAVTPAAALDAALISGSTRTAVDNAFNSLANTVLGQNARTLEDLVKEMLRPMLRSWLDDNLPGLVERLVRAEIERVSRGR